MKTLLGTTAAMLLLTACSTSYRSVTVTVRDQVDHEPVPDATVQVRPVQLFNPTYPHGIITPSPHIGTEARTDATGTATLDAPARHPFELFVLIPSGAPRGVAIDALWDSEPPWLKLLPGEEEGPGGRTLEVRVE